MINWFAAKKSTGAAWGSTCRRCSHSHTHALTHSHTLTQSYARALSLCLSLSRALFAAGANGFSNRSLKSALLFSSSSPPLFRLLLLLLGEISRRYCSHICLSCRCRCSLPAARCSAAQRRRRFLFAGVYVDFIAGVARFIVLICVRLLPLSLALFRCLPLPLSIYFSLFLWLSL